MTQYSYNLYILGCLAALSSAFLWAVGAIMFKKLGQDTSSFVINFGKTAVSSLFLGICILLYTPSSINSSAFFYLSLSGLLGITLGDTYYFKSLMELGPKQSLVITILIPTSTVLFSTIIFKEYIPWIVLGGITLTFVGVFYVLNEKTRTAQANNTNKIKGIFYGILAVLTCSLSIILSKSIIDSIKPLEALFIRQISGLVGIIFWGVLRNEFSLYIKSFMNYSYLKSLVKTTFLSTFLGSWLCFIALKNIEAPIAVTLNSTSPLFALFVSCAIFKEDFSLQSLIGAIIAVLGIGLIFSNI